MNRLLLAACAFVLLTTGCRKPAMQETPSPSPTPTATPAPQRVLTVGVFLALKGAGQVSSGAALNGLAMAAEEVNASGGVAGQSVRLVVRDTRSEPERTAKAVRDLITEDKAVALVGGFSGGSAEAVTVADESGIPLLSLSSTMPGIPSSEPWVFRICQTDFLSGRAMAKFAAKLGGKRALVLYDPSSEYSKTLALAFGKQFKRKKENRIAGEPFATGTMDFTSHLEMVKKKNPDVVYLPVPADQAVEIIKKAREMGLTMPILGTAMWDSPEFAEDLGTTGDNCYFPGRLNPEGASESAKIFLGSYERKYEVLPSAPAALGYDALAVLVNAVRLAGSTEPAKLREALAGTRNFPGLTGSVTTDPELARPQPMPILKLENGKGTFLELVDPA